MLSLSAQHTFWFLMTINTITSIWTELTSTKIRAELFYWWFDEISQYLNNEIDICESLSSNSLCPSNTDCKELPNGQIDGKLDILCTILIHIERDHVHMDSSYSFYIPKYNPYKINDNNLYQTTHFLFIL